MTIFDGLGPYFFRRKMEKRGPWGKKFPAKVGIFTFIDNMIKVLFPICTLIWHVNNYVSGQEKV